MQLTALSARGEPFVDIVWIALAHPPLSHRHLLDQQSITIGQVYERAALPLLAFDRKKKAKAALYAPPARSGGAAGIDSGISYRSQERERRNLVATSAQVLGDPGAS